MTEEREAAIRAMFSRGVFLNDVVAYHYAVDDLLAELDGLRSLLSRSEAAPETAAVLALGEARYTEMVARAAYRQAKAPNIAAAHNALMGAMADTVIKLGQLADIRLASAEKGETQ